MHVALIYPATKFDRKYHYESLPVGLLYLCSILEQSGLAEVDLFDSRYGQSLPNRRDVDSYDVIGFTAMSMQIQNALRLARRLKDWGFQGSIVFGGPHASVAPQHLQQQPFIDGILIGEAEQIFPEYLKYVRGEKHSLWRTWTRSAGGDWRYHEGDAFVEDLDVLPFPARQKYAAAVSNSRMINMITTRGCPYQCNYCQPSKKILFGQKVRRRSVENIIAELNEAREQFGIDRFSIDDDTFTFSRKTVLDFCEAVRPLGMNWSCQSRSDIRREVLEAMRDAGCETMFVGAESGSQRVLDLMNKSNTAEKNSEFIRMCNETGIRTWCNMMVGYPGETEADRSRSLEFVRASQPHRVCVSQVTPFPGTHLWNQHRDDILRSDWHRIARHILRPKFKSMAGDQRSIDYFQVAMTKEWGEPLTADMIEHSALAKRIRSWSLPALVFIKRRLPLLFQWMTRGSRQYLHSIDEAIETVQKGQVEEGIQKLEALSGRFPRETEPLGHLAWICLTTGRPKEAVEWYRRLLNLRPGDPTARALFERAQNEAAGVIPPGPAGDHPGKR